MTDGSGVRYTLFDIEVTCPVNDLLLSPGDAGAAILVRRKGVPIGFWLQEANGAQRVSAGELAKRSVPKRARRSSPPRSAKSWRPRPQSFLCPADHCHLHEGPARGCGAASSILGRAGGRPTRGSAGLEILIVDNAPSDERTRELAAHWSEVRYVREPRPGLNFARNRALQEASGEILAFLDDDVIVDQHWSAGFARRVGGQPRRRCLHRPGPADGIGD